MRKLTQLVIGGLVLVGALTAVGFSQAGQSASEPTQAFDFTAKGSDGKDHSLKSLTEGKTLVLYFIKDGCPINNQAIKYYNMIAEAYKDSEKLAFIGVFNQDEARFEAWNETFKVPYTVLFDKSYTLIKGYGAERSPWVITVNSDRNVAATKKGYSVTSLEKLNNDLAKAAGVEPAKLDFTGAPAAERFG